MNPSNVDRKEECISNNAGGGRSMLISNGQVNSGRRVKPETVERGAALRGFLVSTLRPEKVTLILRP